MKRLRSRLREPTLILLAIVMVSSIYSSWRPIRTVPAIDFYQFWAVGRELAAGQPGDIYSDLRRKEIGQHQLEQARISEDRLRLRTARQRKVLETFSTPFLYTVFGSLSSDDYERDLSMYRSLSLWFLLISVAVLCRLLGYGRSATMAAIAIFAAWFAPTRSDWLVGNVNSFQLGGLVLFLWLSHRFPTTAGHFFGGLLLGLGAMFKPNSALVVAMLMLGWAARRRHQKLVLASAGIAAGTILAFVGSSIAFGSPNIWLSWLSAVSELPDDIITFELGNYAPTRLLDDWLQIDATLAIGLVCGGLTLAALGRGLWGAATEDDRERAGLEDIFLVALAGLVGLLSAPLAWIHYFVAAIPMLLVALRPTSSSESETASWTLARIAAFVALLTIMMRPLMMLEIGDNHDRAVLLCLGTALLFVLGIRELLGMRSASADPQPYEDADEMDEA